MDKLLLLSSKEQEILKPLSVACRILCDAHFCETKTSRKLVLATVNSNDRGKFLFGDNVTEKLKSAKSIQKSGEDFKNWSFNRAASEADIQGQSARRDGAHDQEQQHARAAGPSTASASITTTSARSLTAHRASSDAEIYKVPYAGRPKYFIYKWSQITDDLLYFNG